MDIKRMHGDEFNKAWNGSTPCMTHRNCFACGSPLMIMRCWFQAQSILPPFAKLYLSEREKARAAHAQTAHHS